MSECVNEWTFQAVTVGRETMVAWRPPARPLSFSLLLPIPPARPPASRLLFPSPHDPSRVRWGSDVQSLVCELANHVPSEKSTFWSLWFLVWKMDQVSLALSAFLGCRGGSDG